MKELPVTGGALIAIGVVALVAMRSPAYTGPKPNVPALVGGQQQQVVVTSVAPVQQGEQPVVTVTSGRDGACTRCGDGDKGDAIFGSDA